MIPQRQNQPADFPAGADNAEEAASSLSACAAPRMADNFEFSRKERELLEAPRAANGAQGDPATVRSDSAHETKPSTSPPAPLPIAQKQRRGEGGSEAGAVSTDGDFEAAMELAGVCERFLQLTGDGQSLRMAAMLCGKSVSFFSGEDSMYRRWQKRGVEGLLKVRGTSGAKPRDLSAWIESLPWFIAAGNHFYLLSNRTWKSGSMPEAVRRAISLPTLPVGWKESDKRRFLKAIKGNDTSPPAPLPERSGEGGSEAGAVPVCPPELRAEILRREKNGLPLVPERIASKIRLNPATTRQYRNARETSLDLLNAPGGMRLYEGRLARAGEIVEADDATVNFPVCVPWERDGSEDACVQKFGVKVARFQWLVAICAGTSFVPGFSYTARPRSSYRAEDIVSLMRIVARQHGIPRRWRFERGHWESKLVKSAAKLMDSELQTVYSPHQKPFVEGLFNTLWTKLSVHFPGGHVGRFMGEEREANLLLAACQRGEKDPRRYFPMLSVAIAAFQEVIAEKNRTPVNSAHHGRWVPEERWDRELAIPKMDGASDWMFAPFVREWTVKGMLVGGRVPIFEKISVPFDFSAPWLTQYHGARVRAHFDPADPRCSAQIVLAERFNNEPAGKVLGSAGQVNDTAAYVRLVMGWGDDPAMAGAKARQQAAAGLRREVRAVMPQTKKALSVSEERDGLGKVTKVEGGEIPKDPNTQIPKEEIGAQGGPSGLPMRPTKIDLEVREREAKEFFEGNALDFL